jgi:oligoendopeptidase F
MTSTSLQSSKETAPNPSNDSLPRWDLSDFYPSHQDPQIQKDFDKAKALVDDFAKSYQGKFTNTGNWNGDDLFKAIQEYEKIDELLGKVLSYAYLLFATNVNNPPVLQFFQMVQEQSTTISTPLIFFTLEINEIDDSILEKAYQNSSSLQQYKPWIESVRLFRHHQLSADLEKLLHEKSVTGRSAWVRLFDETLAGIKFNMDGKEMALAEVLNLFTHKDGTFRKQAAMTLSGGLSQHKNILTLVTNTLAKDKEIEDSWRSFPHPVAARNLSNQVEDEVVEALVKAVKGSYGRLSHRYYGLKAKWFGTERLEYWDRNAPLPQADDSKITWNEAKEIVLQAYHAFHPEMAKIGEQFFDRPWIDVPSQPGKESGAFSHSTVPSVHPYILLNFHGKLRDVMTLAHELGHGIHQVLASKQGQLLSSTPLTIAETASVFGEMLTFKALLNKASTPLQRRILLSSKVDDMINTVVRQIAFFEFERTVHAKRRNGELTSEELGDIWIETQKEALGDSINIDTKIRPFWGYISHFIHAPFYVYAYAFGDCLVNSLYSVYESGYPNFQTLYMDMLKAGGTKKYPELLAPFGLDAKNPAFWQQGLNVVSGFIDELESL